MLNSKRNGCAAIPVMRGVELKRDEIVTLTAGLKCHVTLRY
jgi:hypothetical protein